MTKKASENLPDENAVSSSLQTIDERQEVDTAFMDEIKALSRGFGWGARWLGITLAWGLCLFAAIVLTGYAIFGGPITKPGVYYSLIVVVGLLTAGLSMVRRRFK